VIDYWAHSACLDAFLAGLSGGAGEQDLRDRLLPAASADREATMLGALVDHLVHHSETDAELGLVRQAAQLWKKALTVYATVSTARDDIEAALLDPVNPVSVERFNKAAAQLVDLQGDLGALQSQIAAQHAALAPIPYLRAPHPRQQSLDIASWSFTDRFLARRTAAFLGELVHSAPDDRTMAFAAGAVASFVGNGFGSAYLGAVVGGPRRLHRVRDRLARNTVGAWLAVHRGLPSLTDLADLVSFGAAAGNETIPAPTRQALQDALAAAYPNLSPFPDLDIGLRRMTEHLRLLDSFELPPLPKLLAPKLGATLTVGPGSPGGGVKPQAYGDDPGGPAVTTQPGTGDKSSSSGAICLAILAVVTLLIAALIICIGLLTTEGKCTPKRVWETIVGAGGDNDPPTAATAQTLVAAAGSGDGAQLVKEFTKVQGAIWQGLSQARTFLATIGLIYPTPTQLSTPLFQQFASTPNVGAGVWPRREPPDEFDSYTDAPTTPVEQPAGNSPMPPQVDPGYIVDQLPGWIGELVIHFFDEPVNMDLDADRGLRHRCWDLQPGTHITDQPLSVRLLAYGEV
jgi:hypothetical protein